MNVLIETDRLLITEMTMDMVMGMAREADYHRAESLQL